MKINSEPLFHNVEKYGWSLEDSIKCLKDPEKRDEIERF